MKGPTTAPEHKTINSKQGIGPRRAWRREPGPSKMEKTNPRKSLSYPGRATALAWIELVCG